MSGMWRDFITMFVTIDPIGSIPVFLFAASAVPEKMHRSLAIRGVLVAGVVLLGFLVGGQFLLEGLGLRLGAFQVAGGIVLFIFAMTMIFGESKPEAEIAEAEREESHAAAKASAMARAVFPLAMPSIASPGAMLAVVILTDNHRVSVGEQAMTAALLVVVLLITLVLLMLATRVQRLIGASGVSVISRVMGMVIATIAVDAVLSGLDVLGVLDVIE